MKLYREVKCSDRLPEESVPINTTHGLTNTRLYNTWDTMKARCYRQNNKCFPMYGGAGIKVCDEWINNPKAFIDYCMTLEGWDDKSLSLDRIDPYGNYEPGNIRFTTPAIQSRNQRKRKGNNPFTGVRQVGKRFRASITVDYRFISIGYYPSAIEARGARLKYIRDNNLKGFN